MNQGCSCARQIRTDTAVAVSKDHKDRLCEEAARRDLSVKKYLANILEEYWRQPR